jgi:dihydroorotase
VVTHAEDGGLAAGAVATAGEMATRLGLPNAPAEAEALAVARDIALAEIAGAIWVMRTWSSTKWRGWITAPSSRAR